MSLPNILDQVQIHAEKRGDDVAFVFVRRHDDKGEEITWRALWQAARKLASVLPNFEDPQRSSVVVFCNDEKNFVTSLLAVWMRGAVVIPATGGLNANLAARNQHIFQCGKPDVLLHDLPDNKVQKLIEGNTQFTLIHVDNAADMAPISDHLMRCSGGVMQFTSGSTYLPKAVLLDMKTLCSDCATVQAAYSLHSGSIGVHWLPLHHDMGLMGSVVATFWTGCTSVLLRPSVYIQRPIVWLHMISLWRATITSAPNFAYARAVREMSLDDLKDLDLSSLENVIFGGEPVVKETVEAVLAKWGPIGLCADALTPSYGMAEVGLLASSGQQRGGPVFDSSNSEIPVSNLGPVVEGLCVTIRDPRTQMLCPEGAVGMIWLHGPNVGRIVQAHENWRQDSAKSAINTGDFGYVLRGNIYITGREANKIIVRGRNVFAEDIEAIVRSSQDADVCGGVAAIGVSKEGSDSLCILIELTDRRSSFDVESANKSISRTIGVKLAEIVVLRRGSLPRTSSGKVQHTLARDAFLSGALTKRIVSHVVQTNN